MKTKAASPTSSQFAAYEQMFAYFNVRLFGGALPPVLLNFSRHAKAYGFFAPERWEKGKEVKHEISLNPSHLRSRRPIEVASTLVHEMVHLWQQENGKPSRAGYHNEEWASKMEGVGLIPSSTGEPGGARTGQKMTHYIEKVGAIAGLHAWTGLGLITLLAVHVAAVAFNTMPKAYTLPWSCEEPAGTKKPKSEKNKVKYTCPECGANVWGKPELAILCVKCDENFEVASPDARSGAGSQDGPIARAAASAARGVHEIRDARRPLADQQGPEVEP